MEASTLHSNCNRRRFVPRAWLALVLVVSPCGIMLPHVAFQSSLGTALPQLQMSEHISKLERPSRLRSACHMTITGASSYASSPRHGLSCRTRAIYRESFWIHTLRLRIAMRATRIGSTKKAWTVLGLRDDATQTEIKNQYRRLVATEHPDKNPGDPLAEARFKEIVSAYQQLTEPQSESKSDAAANRPVTVVVVSEPLSAEAEEVLKTVNATRRDASPILRMLVTAILVLGLLTQPLGFWAANEITNTCVSGNIDRQWCGQLVQLRCVGEFAFGNVNTCVSDGRKLIAAASNDDALPDGRRIVMRLDDLG